MERQDGAWKRHSIVRTAKEQRRYEKQGDLRRCDLQRQSTAFSRYGIAVIAQKRVVREWKRNQLRGISYDVLRKGCDKTDTQGNGIAGSFGEKEML